MNVETLAPPIVSLLTNANNFEVTPLNDAINAETLAPPKISLTPNGSYLNENPPPETQMSTVNNVALNLSNLELNRLLILICTRKILIYKNNSQKKIKHKSNHCHCFKERWCGAFASKVCISRFWCFARR